MDYGDYLLIRDKSAASGWTMDIYDLQTLFYGSATTFCGSKFTAKFINYNDTFG